MTAQVAGGLHNGWSQPARSLFTVRVKRGRKRTRHAIGKPCTTSPAAQLELKDSPVITVIQSLLA